MNTKLIAVCGMNCGICTGYLREKDSCPGCRFIDVSKSKYCRKCIIRNCPDLKKNKEKFCSSKCRKYPCTRLKNLDKRYRARYGMSMIENLNNIEEQGIRKFVEHEKARWKCRKCGETVCVHKENCLKCNTKFKRKKYTKK